MDRSDGDTRLNPPARAADSRVTPGDVVGGYRVKRLLGSGGCGRVFLADDSRLHRPVALKVIDGLDRDAATDRLLREARSAAALNHPGICTIYEVGEAAGIAFIAMEYVEGRNLRDRLNEGPLSRDKAFDYGAQAASALAYAHQHGVIHRDFKAANVIVTSAGRVKVVDFGLARRAGNQHGEASDAMTLVPAGTIAGTPSTMAPEQVRGEATDARTDVWALGVLLFELHSGTPPFRARSVTELYSSILRDPPTPTANIPAGVRPVILRCLEKDADRRYPDADAVRSALEAQRATGRPAITPNRRTTAAALVFATLAGIVALPSIRGRLTPSPEMPIRLAILPLDNRTGDAAQDPIGIGLMEAVGAELGRYQQIVVIPGALAALHKDGADPLAGIRERLDVTAVLRGTLENGKGRLRVAAELVDTAGGRARWQQAYEIGADEQFQLRGRIAHAVVAAFDIRPEVPGPATRSANPLAYDLYLRALSHTMTSSEPALDRAISLLEQATALDPAFMPAFALLAVSYSSKAAIYQPNDPQWEEKGFAAAQKALALDPKAPEAHYARAVLLWKPSRGFPTHEALKELRLALAARPDYAEALHEHAFILLHVGHLDAAEREVRAADALAPGNALFRFRMATLRTYRNDYAGALAAMKQIPRDTFAAQWHFHVAWSHLSLGQLDDARRVIDEGLSRDPADRGGVLHSARAMLRAKRGDRAGAHSDLEQAVRAGRKFVHFHHAEYAIGAVYATLGEFDKAQEWIENASRDGFPNYTYFEKDVNLEPLRAQPRFREFLRNLRSQWEHIPGEL